MSYQELSELLTHKRTGAALDSRKVANNTYAHRRHDGIGIRLHNTDVVVWHPDETVTLNTGGWYSVTTKDRINTYAAPFSVCSVKGEWHVSVRNERYVRWDTTPGVPYWLSVGTFHDGITLDANNPEAVLTDPPEVQAAREADARVKRDVGRYCKAITKTRVTELYNAATEGGTLGDCFFCQGDMGGADHLASHVEEGYHMATLYRNALSAAGYSSPATILAMGCDDIIRRAVRRYLLAHLLTGPNAGRRAEPTALATGF